MHMRFFFLILFVFCWDFCFFLSFSLNSFKVDRGTVAITRSWCNSLNVCTILAPRLLQPHGVRAAINIELSLPLWGHETAKFITHTLSLCHNFAIWKVFCEVYLLHRATISIWAEPLPTVPKPGASVLGGFYRYRTRPIQCLNKEVGFDSLGAAFCVFIPQTKISLTCFNSCSIMLRIWFSLPYLIL